MAPSPAGGELDKANIDTLVYDPNDKHSEPQATALTGGHADFPSGVVARDQGDTLRSADAPANEWQKDMPIVPGFGILRELGRGGMGVVYLAHQVGLDRFVALKMILASTHAGPEEQMRFRVEAVAISRLQHPNLVQIYECGEHDGRPFFALEFIDGGSLNDHLEGKPQPPRKAAQLVETLARAIHYAHQRGIVHRDLKPANVLLMLDGTPKITDFGLAKRMDSGHGQTKTGSIMGTPSYMAPEQAAGQSKLIGPHTDVYALGAMLYEFLTGRPPFLAESGWDTVVQVINQEPIPPSRLQPKLPRDLETICLKCLEKDPHRRYASAEALAGDLARFLADEPILARPTGRIERSAKWVKRRPALAGMLVLAGLGALALAAGGWAYNLELQRQAEVNRHTLVRLDVASGVRSLDGGDWFGSLVWFAEALEKDHADPGREAVHRMRYASVLRQCPRLRQLWFHQAAVRHASFSPDGRRVVTASADQTAQVWDVDSGQAVGLPLPHRGAVVQSWFSPDGRRLVTASADGTARVWEADTGKPLTPPMAHGRSVTGAAFSPDGRWILTAGDSTWAQVWDAERGERLDPPLQHAGVVHHAAFSPDGRRIVTAGDDRVARLWDAAKRMPVGRPLAHEGAVTFAAFSPDGRRVVTTSDDHTARIWDVATGDLACPPLRHRDSVKWAAFSPGGDRVLTTSDDDTAKIWEAATGRILAPPLRHGSDVRRYSAFSPDGCWVVTSGDDNTARVWDAFTGDPVTANLIHNGTVHCGAFSPDGHLLVSVSDDNTARLWDLATGSLLIGTMTGSVPDRSPIRAGTDRLDVSSPDGKLTVRVQEETAQVIDAATGTERGPRLKHAGRINSAAFSPDSRSIVTASDDQSARVWDSATAEPRCVPLKHASVVKYACFSPDGERVVTASGDNTARIWDARSGDLLTPPLKHTGTVDYATFSRDGLRVASASRDQTARVWDVKTGSSITPSLHHPKEVRRADFSDDGQRLRTVAADGVVREWALPNDDRPRSELTQLAQLLAANRIDARGAYWPLEVNELQAAWDETRRKHPDALAPSKPEVRAWHLRMVDECESTRRWPAAVWHLDKLIEMEPTSGQLWSRRGNVRAELGAWKDAAADYTRALELIPPESTADAWYRLALINLKLGDRSGYRRGCQQLLQGATPGKDAVHVYQAAAACNLSADNAIERSQVVRLIDSVAAGDPKDRPLVRASGAALFRVGRHAEAIKRLNEALSLDGDRGGPFEHLFLALAYRQQGHLQTARDHVKQAGHLIDEFLRVHPELDLVDRAVPWTQRLEVQLLLDEAAELTGADKP